MPGPANGNGANIRVPARRIDGLKIKPGGQFNFVDEVGPITSPPYEMGGVIKNGRIDEDGALSGGMCSAATAMFNAALRAGLRIVERHNHSLYISRYPVGLDATVYNRSKTVAFINDTGHPILIRGIAGRRKVTFEIYGVDDGRKVVLSKPRIENEVEAPRYLEFSDDLEPGERRRVDTPYDGFLSWVTRTVRDASGGVLHRETYRSKYRILAGLAEVGRYPNDPPAGTRILASEYPH